MIDVAKFFFWNIVVGTLFIVFDAYLLIKFFVTLALLMLFILVQIIKIIIGVIYLVKYKCITAKKNEADRETPFANDKDKNGEEGGPPEVKLHIYPIVDAFEKSLQEEIRYAFMMAAEEGAQE